MSTKRKAEDVSKACNGKRMKFTLALLQALPKNLFRFMLEFLQAKEVGVVLAVDSRASPEARRQAWGHLYAKFVGPNHTELLTNYKISLFQAMAQAAAARRQAERVTEEETKANQELIRRLGIKPCPLCRAQLESVNGHQRMRCPCGHIFCMQCGEDLAQGGTDHFFCRPSTCARFGPHQHCPLWVLPGYIPYM